MGVSPQVCFPSPHTMAVPHKWLFIKWEVKNQDRVLEGPGEHTVSVRALQSDGVDRSWGRDMPHLAIFLGDDSGCSAARPLLELGHFQSNGDQGCQHDLGVLVDLGNVLLVAINI